MVAMVRHADEKRGLVKQVERLATAPTAAAALAELVDMQARANPAIWAAARALDATRRTDADAERSWQDRLQDRLNGCRQIIARLEKEGNLRSDLDPAAAADLLWTLTSLRTWEDLVLERAWSPDQYRKYMTRLVGESLTVTNK